MSNYINSLKDFPRFSDDNIVIDFQDRDNKELQSIKNTYHLEDYMNHKSRFESICSIMSFVHHELFCAGDMITPDEMNTFSIMEKKQKGSYFCICYATVLSEMLLSVGIPAVTITCLPQQFDCGCHVCVMAYLDDLKKWAFFDPTFNTYFYSEDKPLDIFEIRQLYQNEKPITFKHIDIDKQWPLTICGEEYPTYDDWYQTYMSKNCFRFSIPQKSQFDYCTANPEYIFINPIGFDAKNEYDQCGDNSLYLSGTNLSL